MDIRSDFKPVEQPLNRLYELGNAFDGFNRKDWSHYKNREDFDRVYTMDPEIRKSFTNLYATGRDCAVALSERLAAFNLPEQHPTLTSFVRSFDGGWLYQMPELKEVVESAKRSAGTADETPWAVWRMIALYEKQLQMLAAAKAAVEELQTTHLYKVENGMAPIESTEDPAKPKWWRNFNQRIAVLALIVAIIGIAASVGLLET